jgi:transcriptional regulator with XRE-family HTH domain
MKFSEMLKCFRIKSALTLRACSTALGVDPSNWSKLERGVSPAPKDQGALETWADFLNIYGRDRQDFLDAAAISRKEIPMDLASDEKVIAALPVFFRAIRGEKMGALIEGLRKIHSPQ